MPHGLTVGMTRAIPGHGRKHVITELDLIYITIYGIYTLMGATDILHTLILLSVSMYMRGFGPQGI